MATSASIEEVTTEDAAPTSGPFKISAKPSKDVLTFKVKATASAVIHAVRVRFKPFNRNSGRLLFSRGMICGSGDRCGSPTARSLAVASPFTTGTITINEADVGSEPDGEYDVRAWAESEEGWSE